MKKTGRNACGARLGLVKNEIEIWKKTAKCGEKRKTGREEWRSAAKWS